MNRKAIVASLRSWFEVSNAAVTKALRGMAAPPLALVRLEEDPNSGREQLVTLTPKGRRHLAAMIERGTAYVQGIVDHMNHDEIRSGLHFFSRITEIVDAGVKPRPARRR